jgi:hypothetical protein
MRTRTQVREMEQASQVPRWNLHAHCVPLVLRLLGTIGVLFLPSMAPMSVVSR